MSSASRSIGTGTLRCAIVASTGGAVMHELLKRPFFRRQIHLVASDRPCGAIDRAAAHGVPTVILRGPSPADFCARLDARLREEGIEWVISFYTRLFVEPLLTHFRNRIVNLHPSLLPSFKGLHGFEDTLAAGVRYAGTTIHLIDERMDEGRVILQSVLPIDPARPVPELRHALFEQQCRSLLQVVRWLAEGRIEVRERGVVVRDATYTDFEFSPTLDDREAATLRVPRPPALDAAHAAGGGTA